MNIPCDNVQVEMFLDAVSVRWGSVRTEVLSVYVEQAIHYCTGLRTEMMGVPSLYPAGMNWDVAETRFRLGRLNTLGAFH